MNYYIDVLKKYAVFSGRASRKEYWMFFLWNFIIGVVDLLVLVLLTKTVIATIFVFLTLIYALAVLIPNVAVLARRIHDINLSAWWILIGLIPYLGQVVIFVFAVIDSTHGDNKYGPNPKGINNIQQVNGQPPMAS
jgi:uncharacterized membrane protein YhaH (DUF805 family)